MSGIGGHTPRALRRATRLPYGPPLDVPIELDVSRVRAALEGIQRHYIDKLDQQVHTMGPDTSTITVTATTTDAYRDAAGRYGEGFRQALTAARDATLGTFREPQ